MRKLSIILVFLMVLAIISGCSKRTASDLATDTGTESDTFMITTFGDTDDETVSAETDKHADNNKDKKAEETKESTETSNEDETDNPAETENAEETKETVVNPDPSVDGTPYPEGGNSTPPSSNTPDGGSITKTPETTSSKTPTPASTTKQTEAPTPAVEPKPESDPNLPATVKVYSFNGGNVAVVNVKNNTGRNCSVQVRGTYKKADGTAIRTETKTFSGLSAGDDNYFIFNPGISFADLSCETKEIQDGTPGYSGFFTFETTGEFEIAANLLPSELGEEYISGFSYPSAAVKFYYSGKQQLYFSVEWIVFDKYGKPLYTGVNRRLADDSDDNITCKVDKKCEKSGNKYVLPDELKGELTFVVALTSVSENGPN